MIENTYNIFTFYLSIKFMEIIIHIACCQFTKYEKTKIKTILLIMCFIIPFGSFIQIIIWFLIRINIIERYEKFKNYPIGIKSIDLKIENNKKELLLLEEKKKRYLEQLDKELGDIQ